MMLEDRARKVLDAWFSRADSDVQPLLDGVIEAMHAVVAEERERCAKVAAGFATPSPQELAGWYGSIRTDYGEGAERLAADIADAIRKGG